MRDIRPKEWANLSREMGIHEIYEEGRKYQLFGIENNDASAHCKQEPELELHVFRER